MADLTAPPDGSDHDPALEELREAYDSGNLIVFAGAGVSASAGLPGWKRLVELLADRARGRGADVRALVEVRELAEKRQYIDALSAVKECLGAQDFCAAVERHLDDKLADEPEVARAIAALAPKLRAVLTTNLDHLLERAFAGKWPAIHQATGDIARRDKYILKLHGTLIDRGSWVLTREQYDRAMYADPRLKAAFTALFHACPILFVGYELAEDDFEAILGQVRALSGEQPPRHFALVPAESVTPYRKKRIESAGVQLIAYENAGGKHAEVVQILRELAAHPEPDEIAAGKMTAEQTVRTFEDVIRLVEEHELWAHQGDYSAASSYGPFTARLLEASGLQAQWYSPPFCDLNKRGEPCTNVVDIVIGLHPNETFIVSFLWVGDEQYDWTNWTSRLSSLARSIRPLGGVVRIYVLDEPEIDSIPDVELVSLRAAVYALIGEDLRAHAQGCLSRWTEDDEKRFVPGHAKFLSTGDEQLAPAAIGQALKASRGTLVLGDFGTGKSTQMKRLAAAMANDYLAQGLRCPAPVLLPLAGLEPQIAAIVSRHCPGIAVEAFRLAVDLGMVIPLFDGLDELILDPHAVDSALAALDFFDHGHGHVRFVVTSRKTLFQTQQRLQAALSRMPSLQAVELQELDSAEVVEFVEKATPSRAEADAALKSIEEIHDLKSLAQRPALLDLIVRNRQKLTHEQMTAAKLYTLVAEEWLGSRKEQQKNLQLEQRFAFARALARRLFDSGKENASYNEVVRVMLETLEERLVPLDETILEVHKAVFLAWDEEGNRFRFAHRSFLEYFLAVDIAGLLLANRSNALDLPRLTPEIIAFLAGLDGWWAKRDVLQTVLSWRYERRVSENALLAIYHAARGRVGEGEALGEVLEAEIPAGARLSGADLSGLHLPWVFLAGADLTGAHLSQAVLRCADLRGARLDRTKADHAVFDGAVLDGARMVEADLFAASFVDASLEEVVWDGADCEGVVILQRHIMPPAMKSSDHEQYPLIPTHQANDAPSAIAWSPDNRYLACATGRAIRMLDAVTGEVHLILAGLNSVVFSPDGRWLASGSSDQSVRLWDAHTGSLLRSLQGHQGTVQSVVFSPDGRWLASGSSDCSVRLWDAHTGALLRELRGHRGSVQSVVFSPDGRWLASGSHDRSVWLWDTHTGSLLRSLQGHQTWVQSVVFSPDGRRLASGSYDRSVRLWDAHTGMLLRSLQGHQRAVNSVIFSPDGRWLASGSSDRSVRLWDTHTGALLRSLQEHHSLVRSVVFSPDGRWLASGSSDQSVRLWDAHTGALLRELQGHQRWVYSVVFSPNGRWLASGSSDQSVRLWDTHTGALLRELQGHQDWVRSVVFSPDGRWLASGSDDEFIRLWDAHTGALLRELQGHQGWVRSVVFSPDGRRLASGSHDHSVRLWDANTGSLLRDLEGHQGPVYSIVFSPDGRWLASGSDDHSVRLWDTHTGALLRELQGHQDWVRSVVFSPDGRWLASGSDDEFIRLWDAHSGSLLRELQGHQGPLYSVVFSPDGRWLASGSDDHSVRVWEANTGSLLRELQGHQGPVYSVVFSPDGRWLASGSDDESIRFWDAHTGECLAILYATASGWITVVEGTPFFVAGGDLSDLIRFVSGRRIMPAELWAPLFDRPDVVEAALAGNKPDLAALGLDSYGACASALQAERARRGLIQRRKPSSLIQAPSPKMGKR